MFRASKCPSSGVLGCVLVHMVFSTKVKGKGRFLELFSTLRPFGLLYSCSQQVPAFISRGATHHTDARDLYQRRRELLHKFCWQIRIYGILLGFFTCRKVGTWDRFFYFPSEGRHTEDFPDTRKLGFQWPVF